MKTNELIDKWLPVLMAVFLGIFIGKVFGSRTRYEAASPRALESEHIVHHKDSTYEFHVTIDTVYSAEGWELPNPKSGDY